MSYNPVPSLNNGNATFNNDLNVSGVSTFDAGVKTKLNSESDGATITFNMDQSNTHSAQLGGNRTLAVSNVDAGQKFTIRLAQDGTGNREVNWWSNINWIISNSGEPTLNSGVNQVDYFGFLCTSGGYYDGFHMTELTAGGGGGGGGGGTTYNVASGLPYASGEYYLQEINQNAADIVTVSGLIGTGGGTGSGLPYASGDYYLQEIRTNSASGVSISGTLQPQITQNSSDIVVVSGLIGGSSSLTVKEVDGSPNVTTVDTIVVSNGTLTDDGGGQVTITTGGGGGGGTTYTAGSGLTLVGDEFNTYGGSGNFEYIELQTDNTVVPKLKFTGSGVTDTPITLEVRSSYESASESGSALLFQGSQGQLFSITDNLSSGVIFSVADIAGLPMLEVDASGHVHIGEYADDITAYQPILISGGVPTSTTNKLYNDAGTLYFNGSAVGAGGGGGLPYASGDYYLQEIRANSASGVAISGLIPPNTFNITGGDGSNYTIDGMGLNSASDPTMYVHKGHTYVFNKTFSGHPFAVSATDGGSVYSDADGNAIEIGSSAGSVTFEVPQDAPDKLYYYCTAHPSNMKGVIYTTTDGSLSGYFESRVDTNAADIITVSGLTGGGGGTTYTAGSGITIDGSNQINVHGGSGHFINLDVDGAFTATTKSFLIDHPSKKGMKLQYGSLEGPENGAYVRGTTNNRFITLPSYWRDLVNSSSITVSLTCLGSFQPLFVEQKNNREIIVGGVCGYYDYVVYGERKDVEKLQVEW